MVGRVVHVTRYWIIYYITFAAKVYHLHELKYSFPYVIDSALSEFIVEIPTHAYIGTGKVYCRIAFSAKPKTKILEWNGNCCYSTSWRTLTPHSSFNIRHSYWTISRFHRAHWQFMIYAEWYTEIRKWAEARAGKQTQRKTGTATRCPCFSLMDIPCIPETPRHTHR